ncbi:DUF924 domain-containing protein [Ectothiorhodospiraceae bacterium WFHF3C12]|nr:DUF924 domain-containing protein [Ectothiorhodospiraceae bacterium WFHF3C12]
MEDPRIEDVHHFWFGDIDDDARVAERQAGLWWRKSEQTDAEIRERFGDLVAEAGSGALDGWATNPMGRLALVILLDQFPRNIHRGTAAAFADDPKALALCLDGIEKGHDERLRPIERVFLYLPMEHAEDAALQARAVDAFRTLRDAVEPHQQSAFDTFLDFAEQHRVVIDRFGRFPHRNAILGRPDTPEEEAYLREPGAGF